jgi:hypothetical protein
MKRTLPYVPVGWGELFDKIAILDIKAQFCEDQSKLKNIHLEIKFLQQVLEDHRIDVNILSELLVRLRLVNLTIWDTENVKRKCEAAKDFSEIFIKASRDSYVANDQRAQIKRKINEILLSEIFEEKIYKN